jgi:chemotaxis protein methyltransferase CheR
MFMKAEEQVLNIAKVIESSMGLAFQTNRIDEFSRHLKEAVQTLGYSDFESFFKKITISGGKLTSEEKKVLAAHLTVSETYFFREKPAITMFCKTIIPELIRKKNGEVIRIWSAGCSSGEEPYTLAMIIKELFPNFPKGHIKILGTDINPNVLTKAKNGLYTSWSFREIPDTYVNKYFKKIGDNYQISDSIKELVRFEHLNLADDIFPGESPGEPNIDIIFCRNVLMYLNHDLIKKISQRYFNILNEEGWLITSQVELNDIFFGHFSKVYSDEGVFYIKDSTHKKRKNLLSPVKETIATPSVSKKAQRQHKKIEIDLNTDEEDSSFLNSELEMLYSEGKYSQCIKIAIAEMEKGSEDNTLLGFLAKSYANTGRYKEAIYILDKLISKNISSDDIFYLYGTVLTELKEIEKAKQMFRKGLYLNPEHLLSHLMLGNILKNEGNNRGASIHYRNVIQLTDKIKEEDIVRLTGGVNKDRLREMVEKLIEY